MHNSFNNHQSTVSTQRRSGLLFIYMYIRIQQTFISLLFKPNCNRAKGCRIVRITFFLFFYTNLFILDCQTSYATYTNGSRDSFQMEPTSKRRGNVELASCLRMQPPWHWRGIEPETLRSRVRRATNCAIADVYGKIIFIAYDK